MVLGAKLRTIMSSIIRWRKGETLRAAKMEQLTAGVVLMRSNNNEKPPSRREEGSELPESETHEREWSSQPAPAKRVSTMPLIRLRTPLILYDRSKRPQPLSLPNR